MQRKNFLAQAEVAGFIEWLASNLPLLQFNLNFRPSKFVLGGLQVNVNGFEQVLQHYRWSSSWRDNNGAIVISSTWLETKESLGKLRAWLIEAIDNNDETQTLAACLQILKWGGVRGAIPFLHRLANNMELIAYLRSVEQLLVLDSDQTDLRALSSSSILRFDSGLTKIHSLLDKTGSPIYDSRVGAAMGMLYSLYRQQNNHGRPMSQFPSGAARGNQIRNPGDMPNGLLSPQFSRITYKEWARWQVRLGWIIRELLERTDWFANQGALPARCHAFEACLFVIGYDLRCFGAESEEDAVLVTPRFDTQSETEVTEEGVGAEEVVKTAANRVVTRETAGRSGNWVPTGHSFSKIIQYYLNFRKEEKTDGRRAFIDWLLKNTDCQSATANAYCFPFSIREFDLFGRSIKDIERIVAGKKDGLLAVLSVDELEPFTLGDEREKVCLVDVFITGKAYELFATDQERRAYIMRSGYAGTSNAAGTLMSVGRDVGRHFDLFEAKFKPTALFKQFFNGFSLEG